ncbi:Separin [Bulinus truncatus]|nr:Separin [Bulinus truncatus]
MYIPKLKHNGGAEMLNSRLSNIPEGMYIPKLKHNSGAEMLNSGLSNIPEDWTVVQLTVVNYDPLNPGRGQLFVTRMTSDQSPITLEIPSDRWPTLMRAVRVYESAIVHDDKLTPEQYWTYRYKKDADMQNVVYYLQEVVLAGHKWLMRGRADLKKYKSVGKLLDKAASSIADTVDRQHGYKLDQNTLRVILEVLLCSHEQDIESLIQSVWPKDVAQSIVEATLALQSEVVNICGQKVQVIRGPVILILDKTLNKLPWESMPDFLHDTITRVPSLRSLLALLSLHRQKMNSGFQQGVNRDSVVAVIDPETNLINAVNVLLPQLQQYKGWTCLTQKAPTVSDLKKFLTDYSLYLYSGHGWGNQFVGGDDLQMFHAKAVAVLMGCHSGKLDYKPRVDGDGGPLYFLLAGCPSVLGNLWLVTDKDIDKLTSKLAAEWMSQNEPVSLSHVLAVARKVCKLLGLNGYAPVIYGLPVLMNC